MKQQSLKLFYEEQVKANRQYNFKKQKLAAAKKYSIPQKIQSTIGADPIYRSLLL